MFPSFLQPKPAPPSRRNEELIPEYTANIVDKISFGWIFPLLRVRLRPETCPDRLLIYVLWRYRRDIHDQSRKMMYGT